MFFTHFLTHGFLRRLIHPSYQQLDGNLKALKIPRGYSRAGSSPAARTTTGVAIESHARSCLLPHRHHLRAMNRFSTAGMSFDARQIFSGRAFTREQRIARIDALATLLDTAFVIPGTQIRFGLDALIGLVPGIGDAITTVMSLYIVSEARSLGAPPLLVARMIANVVFDGVVGAVPLVGDAFDVVFRANRRNMALLRGHLDKTEGPRMSRYYGARA